jgi:PAS domain S-box-containing protein
VFELTAQDRKIKGILSPNEIEWLKKNVNTIRFAPYPNWPPGDYVEKGIHKGITSDYINLLEEYLGVNFQRVYFESWSQILNALKNSEIDFVGAIQKTEERDKFLNFTDFYFEVPLVILVRNDFNKEISESSLSHLKLASPISYASTEYIHNNYPNAKLVECNNDLSALIKTSLGETDATAIDLFVASHLVEKYGINNLSLALELDYRWEIRMGIRKDLPEFNTILNKVLNIIKNDAGRDLYKKWINIQKIEKLSFFEKNRTILIFILIIVLLLIVFVIYYNIALRKMVRKRTKELIIAEKKVLENEKKFRVIFEKSPTGILLSSLDKTMEVNQSFLDIVGYTKEELNKLKWSDITHPDDRPFSEQIFQHMLNNGQQYARFEKRYISKRGDEIWVDLSTSLKLDENNKPQYFITTVNDITIQKYLQNELKLAKLSAEQSEKKYRMLIETSPDAIVITDLRGNHLFQNKTYFTSLGFESDEEFDLNGFTRVHPDDIEGVKELFNELLVKGRNTGEYRVKNRKGEWIYRHTIATVIYDELNNPKQILTVMRDITDKKIMELKLVQANNRYSFAEEVGKLGVWEWDIETNEVYWSDNLYRIFGYKPNEIPSSRLSFQQQVHSKDYDLVNNAIKKVIIDYQDFNITFRTFHKDGNVIWLSNRAKVLRLENSQPKKVIGVVENITIEKNIEIDLRIKERALQTSLTGIALANHEGNIIYVNQSFISLWGYSTDGEVLGRNVLEFWQNKDEITEIIENLFTAKTWSGERYAKRKDGTTFLCQISSNFLTDEYGNVSHIMGSFWDITERKNHELLVANSLEEKELLLREIHHRVKNNLQIISSLIYLQSLHIDDKSIADIFQKNLQRIRSMALVHDFLYQSENLKCIDFKQYVMQLVTTTRDSFGNSTKLSINVDTNQIIPFEQATYIGLLITELLNNTMKHAFKEQKIGEISITLTKENGDFHLVYADNGMGISNIEEVLNCKSFGINMIKTLVHQLNGTLEYSSINGTQVKVNFPQNT